LIFYRGLGCSHCRRQLDALTSQKASLDETKVKVIAVCPDSGEDMKQAMVEDEVARSIPFLLLSDPELVAFKQYRCFDGLALHGTFVIDQRGVVQWQDIGDEPFMEIEELLAKCRQMKAGGDP
jgi:peroxiredoxin